jgi:hypothetical protein
LNVILKYFCSKYSHAFRNNQFIQNKTMGLGDHQIMGSHLQTMEKYHFCKLVVSVLVKSPPIAIHPYWLQKLVEKIKLEINIHFLISKSRTMAIRKSISKNQIQYKDRLNLEFGI